MKIEDHRGEALTETTITVNDEELIDLLQGLADVVEGEREHLHFQQLGGPQLVVRRGEESDPIGRQMDWWLGPLVLLGLVLVVVGATTMIAWAARLIS